MTTTTSIQTLVSTISTSNVKTAASPLVKELIEELKYADVLDDEMLESFAAKSWPNKPSKLQYILDLANEVLNPRRTSVTKGEDTKVFRDTKTNDEFILTLDKQFCFGLKPRGSKKFTILLQPLVFTVGKRTFVEVV
jgi:hypothetical protein